MNRLAMYILILLAVVVTYDICGGRTFDVRPEINKESPGGYIAEIGLPDGWRLKINRVGAGKLDRDRFPDANTNIDGMIDWLKFNTYDLDQLVASVSLEKPPEAEAEAVFRVWLRDERKGVIEVRGWTDDQALVKALVQKGINGVDVFSPRYLEEPTEHPPFEGLTLPKRETTGGRTFEVRPQIGDFKDSSTVAAIQYSNGWQMRISSRGSGTIERYLNFEVVPDSVGTVREFTFETPDLDKVVASLSLEEPREADLVFRMFVRDGPEGSINVWGWSDDQSLRKALFQKGIDGVEVFGPRFLEELTEHPPFEGLSLPNHDEETE
ncbi:MAG: hypothetical protein ACFCVE_10975 [Phycisphaerae bacterium]